MSGGEKSPPLPERNNMDVKARCLVTFKDGNVYPGMVKIGQVIVVPEGKYNQIVASGGKFEVIAKMIPAPTKEHTDDKAKS